MQDIKSISQFINDAKFNQLAARNQPSNTHSLASGQQISGNNFAIKDFSQIFKDQLAHVNAMEIAKDQLQQRYTLGDTSVSLPEVMMSIQKANIATSFTIEVRNHLLSAYEKIMNMNM